MALVLRSTVGERGINKTDDVLAVQRALATHGFYAGVTDGECNAALIKAIETFQAIFLPRPDGQISPRGNSVKFLGRYKIKNVGANVALPGQLQKAWDILNPILPEGSYCSSGFRSPEEQRTLLVRFFTKDFASDILATHGQPKIDAVLALTDQGARDVQMATMLKGVGQLIAVPGRSMHQQGKAFDIGGPADAEQVRTTQMVARAHATLFSGKILKERNGCVHVEIR